MVVRALVAAVDRVGLDRARLLKEAGLDSLQLDDGQDIHARLPLVDYRRIVQAAYDLTADPALGLHMGERMSIGSFDVLGHLTEQGTSLRDALLVAVRYSRIVTEAPRLVLEEHNETATVRLQLPRDDELLLRLTAEFSVIAMWRMVQRFVGEDALPKRALFPHAEPIHRDEYTRRFGGRERFSQVFTGLEIERAWLDRAPACRHPELRGYLQTRAEFLLAKTDRDLSAAERVRRWLAAQPDLARPTLALAARELCTSTRTLRRRLHAENVQFSALLDDARAAQAKRMLTESGCSIQDAAYALGFRTPSAFSRAFKRWTGVAPKQFRPARGLIPS